MGDAGPCPSTSALQHVRHQISVPASQVVLEHMRLDDKVKVAVWTGAGKAFSAGADFGERVPSNPAHHGVLCTAL